MSEFKCGYPLTKQKKNVATLRQILPPEAAIQSVQIPISIMGSSDKFTWPHNSHGSYTVKTGYHIAYDNLQQHSNSPSCSITLPSSFWNCLRNIKTAQKMKFFLWRMCNNAIPVIYQRIP